MLSHHSAAANITWSGVTNTLLVLFVLLVTMLIINIYRRYWWAFFSWLTDKVVRIVYFFALFIFPRHGSLVWCATNSSLGEMFNFEPCSCRLTPPHPVLLSTALTLTRCCAQVEQIWRPERRSGRSGSGGWRSSRRRTGGASWRSSSSTWVDTVDMLQIWSYQIFI